MAIEIERKFLVINDSWKKQANGTLFKQAYLSSNPERTVRVRISAEKAFITIKSKSQGVSREEFEFPIPVEDAEALLTLCETAPLEKIRHHINYGDHLWEIDEFMGSNTGLVIAEIELQNETESFEHPAWLGEEVSDDKRYFNSQLTLHPFTSW